MTYHGHSIFPLFDTWVGFAILGVYAVLALGLTSYFASGYNKDKQSFLLANRELGMWQGALSIAAAWLWAPGLFISAQQAYVNGMVGLFWFCLGNFITLMFFAWFAKSIRDKNPDGYTMSGFIQKTYTGKAYLFYRFEMIILAICAFGINLIAGSTTVALLTGIDYTLATILMSVVALLYAFRNGLKATVVTEVIKIVVVWAGVLLLVPLVISNSGGWDNILAGMAGVKGVGTNIIGTPFAWGVFTSFGIAAFLGHMAGPWRDNSFYQRAYAIQPKSIIPAFVLAAFIFIMIPIGMGLIGFAAAGAGVAIPDNLLGNTNIIAIANFLPPQAAIIFTFMVFAGLIAILDSQMASITNLVGNDLVAEHNAIPAARAGMLFLVALGIILANSGVTIGSLFLFFSIMGATLFLPSMLIVIKPELFYGPSLFNSLLISFLAAMLLYFAVGSVFYATLVAVFLTPALAYGFSVSKQ